MQIYSWKHTQHILILNRKNLLYKVTVLQVVSPLISVDMEGYPLLQKKKPINSNN